MHKLLRLRTLEPLAAKALLNGLANAEGKGNQFIDSMAVALRLATGKEPDNSLPEIIDGDLSILDEAQLLQVGLLFRGVTEIFEKLKFPNAAGFAREIAEMALAEQGARAKKSTPPGRFNPELN